MLSFITYFNKLIFDILNKWNRMLCHIIIVSKRVNSTIPILSFLPWYLFWWYKWHFSLQSLDMCIFITNFEISFRISRLGKIWREQFIHTLERNSNQLLQKISMFFDIFYFSQNAYFVSENMEYIYGNYPITSPKLSNYF